MKSQRKKKKLHKLHSLLSKRPNIFQINKALFKKKKFKFGSSKTTIELHKPHRRLSQRLRRRCQRRRRRRRSHHWPHQNLRRLALSRNRHCNRHSLSLRVFRQNHSSGAAGVKSREIKLPRQFLSRRSLRRRRAGRRSVRLSLLRREIASLTFPHEIQQNSIPKNIIIIFFNIFKLK